MQEYAKYIARSQYSYLRCKQTEDNLDIIIKENATITT